MTHRELGMWNKNWAGYEGNTRENTSTQQSFDRNILQRAGVFSSSLRSELSDHLLMAALLQGLFSFQFSGVLLPIWISDTAVVV